jgi:GT2 family glycosyltransferase
MIKPKVSVVIVTRNRVGPLERNLTALKGSEYPITQTIVVDNGSTDGSEEYVRRHFKNIQLVHEETNTGAAKGRNIGAKYATTDFIFFLDDDAYIDKSVIKECILTVLKDKNIAVVQTMVLSSFDKKKILGIAHDINTTTSLITAYGINERNNGQYSEEIDIPMVGTGWLIRRSVFEKIGGFDEKFFIPYEDSDLSLRVHNQGFRIVFCPKAKIWHDDLKPTEINPRIRSIGIASPERAFFVGRNKVYFMKKHSRGWGRALFFSILLPMFICYHTLIIVSSLRFDILLTYYKGLISGFKL